jgi:hypothetical protein
MAVRRHFQLAADGLISLNSQGNPPQELVWWKMLMLQGTCQRKVN